MKLAFPLLSAATLVLASSSAMALSQSSRIQSEDVPSVDVQMLDVRTTTSGRLETSIYLGSEDHRIELEPHSVLGPKARSRSRAGGGGLTTYQGMLAGDPASRVAATMRDGRLRALVWRSGSDEPWWVAPADELDERMPAELYSALPSSEWPRDGGVWSCVPDPAEFSAPPERLRTAVLPKQAAPRAMGSSGTFRAEVVCEADYEFVQDVGSAAIAQDEMEEAIFFASAIYEFTFGIRLEIVDLVAHAGPGDPYSATSQGGILPEFHTYVGAQYDPEDWDLAQLFTGRVSGTLAGLSYCTTICNAPQSLLAVSWVTPRATVGERVRLTAHEFGHTFGAGHCHENGGNCNSNIDPTGCGIMGTNSIFGFGVRFGNQSIASISGNPNLYGCLDPDVPSGPPPTLNSVSPLTVEALAAGSPAEVLSLVGVDLGSTHQVTIGGSVVTLYGLDVIDDSNVSVDTPAPARLGTSSVQLANAAGWSNSLTVTYVETDPARFVVTATDSFLGVFVEAGGRVNANYKLLISDQSTTMNVAGFDILSAPSFTFVDTFDGVGLGGTDILPVSGIGTYYVQLVTRDATGALYASPVETVSITL